MSELSTDPPEPSFSAAPVDTAPAAPTPGAAPPAPFTPAPVIAAAGPALYPRVLVWLLAALTLLAVVAMAVAWRANQRVGHFEQELVRRQQESAAQANEARMVARDAQDSVRDAGAKVALLEARVAEVAVQRTQLEDLIQSLSRSRDENLLGDIEASIRVAVQQTVVTGSAEPLVAVLKQADERLARDNLPRLENVRRAIGRDLDRIKGVSLADVPSLAIKIDEAIRLVDGLPLLASSEGRRDRPGEFGRADAAAATRSSSPSSATATPGVAGSAPAAPPAWAGAAALSSWGATADDWWQAATGAVWAEARSLLRVTRVDHPDAMLLAPEQAFFVRENLKLRLLNARLALLSRQFETAQSDLGVARAGLERYFDRGSKRTAVVLDLLAQVTAQARQVNVPRPDDTLAALTAAGAGR